MIRTIILVASLSCAGVSIAQTPPLDVTDPSITKKPTLDVRNSRRHLVQESPVPTWLQGEVKFVLCVDASGRVTSHLMTQSSGQKALDDATVKFLEGARFKPAEVNGTAVAVCSHGHTQVWNLNRR